MQDKPGQVPGERELSSGVRDVQGLGQVDWVGNGHGRALKYSSKS